MIPIDLDAEPPREIRPVWLGAADHGWLTALTEVFRRHDGRPRHELDAALRLPLVVPSPHRPRRFAENVLARCVSSTVDGLLPPIGVRERVFTRAAGRRPRGAVLAEIADELGVTVDAIEAALFCDLPSERKLVMPDDWPPPFELATKVNQAMATAAIRQSVSVRLELFGESRRVVRVARLRGLLCTVRSEDADGDCVLDLSGPYSLLRATTVYGRALASVVPQLVHASRFVLRATAKNGTVTRLERTDPIFDEVAPPPCDSIVESVFVERFKKATTDWDLVREPEPVAAGATLVFPDFALVHRRTARRVLVEIVGFWTPEYLAEKLAALRRARIENLVLCLSDELRCGTGELPEGAIVVPFKRRVDPKAVLDVAERL